MLTIRQALLTKKTIPAAASFGLALAMFIGLNISTAFAEDLDTIGIRLLRQVDPTLIGSGVRVAHVEGPVISTNDFEVNPAGVAQPASLFTWISSSGSATTYPNAVGTESGHANAVGANFYGPVAGAAPGISHVDNYEAGYFVNNIIAVLSPPSIPGSVVNQSFIFLPAEEAAVNSYYDNYVYLRKTIFSSGVGNNGTVSAPGTAYNSLGVGVYGISTAVGPSSDGRCKPDLVAPDQANFPQGANSYSIPYVSGGAAILVQAGARGDGGTTYSAATNSLTVKALLINGAIKPSDWTNSVVHPLDYHYGAGVLNVFNSWNQLSGHKRAFIESTSNTTGAAHPPGANPNNEASLIAWDYNSITNSLSLPAGYKEQVNHYYFLLSGTNNYTLTSTLTWNRQQNQTTINDLNLFLYNCANSNLVMSSTSAVDNVEHIFLPSLPPGRYDLQVHKNPLGQVTASETYALAFEIFNLRLNVTRSGSNILLSWPIAPTGFRLLSTSSLTPAITWTPVAVTPVVTNNQNVVTLPATASEQYFRLVRP